MVDTIKAHTTNSTSTSESKTKHARLIETTYRHNLDSDYTEKIEQLDKSFKYANNSDVYWSKPEQSLLYGTPLYEEASPTQKLALNHLHWFANYNYVADTETETVTFNQVTASVFNAIGGYETVAQELEFETTQEYVHIHAFRKIGLSTATALMGKSVLKEIYKWHSYEMTLGKDRLANYKYYAARMLTKAMLRKQKQYYSQYLQELEAEEQFIGKKPTTGVLGRGTAPSLQRFFSFNWGGGSPFLACQYYVLRMMGNMTLKNMEHPIAKYYKKLANKDEFIPAPTAVSHYHFLDESFHTTMSQVLGKDMYKDFPSPTAYEKFVANLTIYMVQCGTLGGLSGAFTHRYFPDDCSLMALLYRLLQTPLFGMSASEAIIWLERCLCQEHDGFHLGAANHQRLWNEHRRFFEGLDYLWPVNREMRVMAAGGSIPQAIQRNRKTFRQFSQTTG